MVEVIRVVEVVYRCEESLGVKGPSPTTRDVGLCMTMLSWIFFHESCDNGSFSPPCIRFHTEPHEKQLLDGE